MLHHVIVYYLNHNEILPDAELLPDPFTDDCPDALCFSPGGTMREKGRRLSSNSILRRYASHYLLCRVFGLVSVSQLNTGEHGKPELSDSCCPEKKDRFFNLSHGKDYTILAVSDAVLGADIQEVPIEETSLLREKGKRKRELTAHRAFPDSFLKEYETAAPDGEAAVFTRLWTCLEAILKAEGCGFACDLREHPEFLQKWKRKSFSLADHAITLAMRDDFVYELREIHL